MTGHILTISDTSTLREIKTDFQNAFPFLKLEFFRKSHGHGETSPAKEMLSDNLMISDARKGGEEGSFLVAKHMTVESLEDEFEQRFGLHIQVFRKSGRIWLETSITDKWTLESQNQHGRESASKPE